MSVFERSEAAQKALNNAVETEQKYLKLKGAVMALDPLSQDFCLDMDGRCIYCNDWGCKLSCPAIGLRKVLKELDGHS